MSTARRISSATGTPELLDNVTSVAICGFVKNKAVLTIPLSLLLFLLAILPSSTNPAPTPPQNFVAF
jgi:hypothetical protein